MTEKRIRLNDRQIEYYLTGFATELGDSDRRRLRSILPLFAFLERWVCNSDESPYCAVLGEFGIGKTTTLKHFAKRLFEKHPAARADSTSSTNRYNIVWLCVKLVHTEGSPP